MALIDESYALGENAKLIWPSKQLWGESYFYSEKEIVEGEEEKFPN